MKNRFLADENVPGALVIGLRSAGHDVTWIVEAAPGLVDPDVLAKASLDSRILLSADKDFGELARRERGVAAHGIVLLRVPKPATVEASARLVAVLSAEDGWAGHFSVIEPGRIRRRKLETL